MTDDLEPRLRQHLTRRASGVEPVPDAGDLEHRIADRRRRTTRALGTALAFALAAGPIAGWALARSTEDDVQALSAAGGASTEGGSASDGLGGPAGYGNLDVSYLDYLGTPMELVSERTTDEGLHLVTRRWTADDEGLGRAECVPGPDGLVRVGVTDGDLVGTVVAEVAEGSRSFGVTGAAEGRPLWVVVARTDGGTVEARFPNGTVDQTEPTDGLAVLAAYAEPGRPAPELFEDAVELTGLSGEPGPVIVTSSYLAGTGCGTAPEDEPAMPAPGDPPPDEEAARAAVTDAFLTALQGRGEDHPELRERPEVWADSNERFKLEQPDYAVWALEVYPLVHEVVFTEPDRATVRFELVSDNASIPAPGERIGEAVLIDGTWKVSIETSCELVGLAGIECDLSL